MRTVPKTSSLKVGIVIPSPTFTASTPVPPRTIELLAETSALYPSADAFVNCVELPGPELYPIKVLFEPVVLALAATEV